MTVLNISVPYFMVPIFGKKNKKKEEEINRFRSSLSHSEVLHFVFTTGISSSYCKPTFFETFRSKC